MDSKPRQTNAASWLIDGYNVLHAGMLRREDRVQWWTRSQRDRLIERAGRLEADALEIWIAFDGEDEGERTPRPSCRSGGPAAPTVRVVYARSADAWILERVRRAPDPGRWVVVTADRSVAERARQRGAEVVSPRLFLERCPGACPRDAGTG